MERTIKVRVDDFDKRTPSVETVRFTTGGATYEVDLGPENAAEWADVVAAYVAAGRRVKATRAGARRKAPSAREVRAWAAGQGIDVKPNGKVPAAVMAAYRDAH